jgi:hypothetical protein
VNSYLSDVTRVLPVSTKHHVDYHMVMFPTKFCFFSYDPKTGEVLQNVAHRQLHGCIKADPGLLAKLLGVSVLPMSLTDKIPDRPSWKLLLSVKNVPLCWIYPYKIGQTIYVEKVVLLTVEEYMSLIQKDEDDE